MELIWRGKEGGEKLCVLGRELAEYDIDNLERVVRVEYFNGDIERIHGNSFGALELRDHILDMVENKLAGEIARDCRDLRVVQGHNIKE